MSCPIRVVFEEDGYPCELHGEAEWARAISLGRLGMSTPVAIYSDAGVPKACLASEVPELRAMFGLVEAESAQLPSSIQDRESGGPNALRAGGVDFDHAAPAPRLADLSGSVPPPSSAGHEASRGGPWGSIDSGLSGTSISYPATDGQIFSTAAEARRHSQSPKVVRALSERRRKVHQSTRSKPQVQSSPITKDQPTDNRLFFLIMGIIILFLIFS